MPIILTELIGVLGELKEASTLMEGLKALSKFTGGSGKLDLLEKAIKALTPGHEMNLRKMIGDEMTKRIKSSVSLKDKNTPISEVDVSKQSSWVKSLSWNPLLHTATLKTKTSDKVYKLPFFPRRVVNGLKEGTIKSPGKAIWNSYWRVVGKGSVLNKTKNKAKVEVAKKVKNLIPTPKIKNPLTGKRLIKPARIKSMNIPKTGAKGISIKLKAPHL